MPPRIARSSVQVDVPKNARKKNRKRTLDAYAIASHSLPEKVRMKPSRLGEYLDDGSRQKRRRSSENDNDVNESDEDETPAKRSRTRSDNDDVEEGSDSEGNEWILGGLREDDDDSDLDSDEAFGESDEERFAGFSFRGSSGGKKKKSSTRRRRSHADEDDSDDIDLNEEAPEEEEEDEDSLGTEGVDLATMLDDDHNEMLGGKDTTAADMGEESASEGGSNESESSADSEQDEGEEDEEEEGGAEDERIARMRDRIEALDAEQETSKARQTTSQQTALTVDDLLADLDPAARKQFSAALKTRKTSDRPKTLTVPLPPRQQARLDRQVATKRAKEQLDRWKDTVVHNRRAEFLSFPLKDPDRGERLGKDKFVEGSPQNELEANIRKIMEESGMVSKPGQSIDEEGEDAVMKSEGLSEKNMPVEEVMKKRADLRRARELLFREETKAKRIAKIKSKSYRRVHRKEKERQAEREREFENPEPDEDEKEKADRRRAEERVSTKHRDSKWAKSLKATNRTIWDKDARGSVNEQARRNEELRRRIAGQDVSDKGESDDDSLDSEEDESEQIKKQLDRIQNDEDREGKGLANMKFMRAANERHRKQNEEDVERLRHDLAVEDGDVPDSADEVEDQSLGRAIFGPKGRETKEAAKKAKRSELEEGDASDEDDDGEQQAEVPTEKQKKQVQTGNKKANASGTVINGSSYDRNNDQHYIAASDWIAGPKSSRASQRRAREVNDGILLDPITTTEKRIASADAEQTSKLRGNQVSEPAESNANAGNTDGWTLVTYGDRATADSDSEVELSNPVLTRQEQNAVLNRRAFAADDVKKAFDAEKADAAASEDEKEISSHLPGWGSWTGEGLSKSVRKANNRQRHNPLYKTKLPGVKAEDRKDAKLENVIVSEKQERKGKKYKADILPHGFEKKEQYERSLRVPMGPEWVTKDTFQKSTRPRVVVKPGVAIGPMDRPLM